MRLRMDGDQKLISKTRQGPFSIAAASVISASLMFSGCLSSICAGADAPADRHARFAQTSKKYKYLPLSERAILLKKGAGIPVLRRRPRTTFAAIISKNVDTSNKKHREFISSVLADIFLEKATGNFWQMSEGRDAAYGLLKITTAKDTDPKQSQSIRNFFVSNTLKCSDPEVPVLLCKRALHVSSLIAVHETTGRTGSEAILKIMKKISKDGVACLRDEALSGLSHFYHRYVGERLFQNKADFNEQILWELRTKKMVIRTFGNAISDQEVYISQSAAFALKKILGSKSAYAFPEDRAMEDKLRLMARLILAKVAKQDIRDSVREIAVQALTLD